MIFILMCFHFAGELDRGKLGAIIFTDERKRKLVNSITHPKIYAEMRRQVFQLFLKGIKNTHIRSFSLGLY